VPQDLHCANSTELPFFIFIFLEMSTKVSAPGHTLQTLYRVALFLSFFIY
jgi:hypothetical protein